MSLAFVVAVGVALGVACALRGHQPLQVLFPATVGLIAVYPKVLTGTTKPYVGIAPWTISGHAYTIGVVACLAVCLIRAPVRVVAMAAPWSPFVVVSLILATGYWPNDSLTHSGEEHVLEGITLLVVAAVGAERGLYTRESLTYLLLAVTGLEVAVLALDYAHIAPSFLTREVSPDTGSRVTGTTSQPNELGKLCWLVVVGLLSYHSPHSRVRKLQVSAIVMALVMISLAESRAALVAAAVAFVVAAVLQPDRVIRTRSYVAGGAAAVAFAFVGAPVVGRFITDPQGGSRPVLHRLASEIISAHRAVGVGIDHYVQAVGSIDPLTASGVPVHSAFLLAAAEMGVVAAVLLWVPLVLLGIPAIRKSRRHDDTGDAARALVGLLLGVYVVGSTGWGLLSTPDMELLFAITGYLFGATLRRQSTDRDQPSPAPTRRRSTALVEQPAVTPAPVHG